MTGWFFVLFCGVLSACTSLEDLCFAEATRDYRATKSLIAQAESAAEKGYEIVPDYLEFTDVSECGPTLEARAICTTQSRVELEAYRPVDRQEAAKRAELLRSELPKLKADAQRAYTACLASGPGV